MQDEQLVQERKQLEQWDAELQGREQAYWENRRKDEEHVQRLKFFEQAS